MTVNIFVQLLKDNILDGYTSNDTIRLQESDTRLLREVGYLVGKKVPSPSQ
ncbi:MAG: hypothetical protein HEQ20_19310 [Aphanizomenon flos-aquae KM1D3_PB]|uniref:hypothetical protein n=1 Tax=Aphanizomenon flos-aquae TaxID=1176 RepID=UPI000B11BDFB|nr:hypothetical protein [Aphanizomenon flos-aquae]QSV72498.1 MAG: hypothetical protein HEQ20_19310 [Aphanizomenon flos-aquae KM1D3_PB]